MVHHRYLLYIALLCLGTSCATPWREIREGDGWVLFAQDEGEVEAEEFAAALDAGLVVVEKHFGPFEKSVKVHAFSGGARMDDGTSPTIARGEAAVQEVPGIGPASVRGFHTRGTGLFGERSRVNLGEPDVGLTIHELVHSRLAECAPDLPLWLEEGLAMLLGDGALFDGCWEVDGLACWPLRELSEESLSDDQLQLLLSLESGMRIDIRTNALVHFFGWAIVFDLYRESGSFDWKRWSDSYSQRMSVAEARRRMNRTLHDSCPKEWLARLDDPNPAVRLCCARGLWRLMSYGVGYRLYEALSTEEHPEVAAAMALNLLATTTAIPFGRRGRYMARRAHRVLRDPKLEDPLERKAMRTIYEDFYYDYSPRRDKAMKELARFLEE